MGPPGDLNIWVHCTITCQIYWNTPIYACNSHSTWSLHWEAAPDAKLQKLCFFTSLGNYCTNECNTWTHCAYSECWIAPALFVPIPNLRQSWPVPECLACVLKRIGGKWTTLSINSSFESIQDQEVNIFYSDNNSLFMLKKWRKLE